MKRHNSSIFVVQIFCNPVKYVACAGFEKGVQFYDEINMAAIVLICVLSQRL
jgi:hypothetical protein